MKIKKLQQDPHLYVGYNSSNSSYHKKLNGYRGNSKNRSFTDITRILGDLVYNLTQAVP